MSDEAVVLFRDGPPADWRAATECVVRAEPSWPRPEVQRACRRGHGLLPVAMPREQAVRIALALTAAGMPAETVGKGDVVAAPKAFVIRNGMPKEEGFFVPVKPDEYRRLPWASIRIVHLGYVRPSGRQGPPVLTEALRFQDDLPGDWRHTPDLGVSDLVSLGLNVAAHITWQVSHATLGTAAGLVAGEALMGMVDDVVPMTSEHDKPKEPEVWLELLALDPLLRIRIRRNDFRYEFLGARKAISGKANFLILFKDLAGLAAEAALTGHAAEGLAGRSPERERWLLDEKEHDLALTALLTREKWFGLPRPEKQ